MSTRLQSSTSTGFLISDEWFMPEVLEVAIEGEIRHRLFVVVRPRFPHAKAGSASFAMRRHFSPFILCVATYIATFFSGKIINYKELRSD